MKSCEMLSQWLALGVVFLVQITATYSQSGPKWQVIFGQNSTEIHMNSVQEVNMTISGSGLPTDRPYSFYVRCDKPQLATVKKVVTSNEIDLQSKDWFGTFDIRAEFLGNAKVFVELVIDNRTERSTNDLNLIIIREVRVIDTVFTVSVALLVSLLYINFGAALDLSGLKGIVRRPVGPAIAFVGQFVFMPLLSFGMGYLLFPNNVEFQLGMFFTGVSPAGGASNIWTVILQGNVNLSITMTAIGNFAAFGMMPLWIFTLGRVIFEKGNLGVPYESIATFAVSLIVPLAIGVAISKFLPRVSRILVRLLKPVSMLLILFIVIFAIVTNLYLFELFSWQIIVAGLGLPFFGYIIGWTLAKVFKQPSADALTIAIETGIQNTGIAIFLLRFSLPQPQADLTTVIPVSVAIMTPIPLIVLYVYQKIKNRKNNSETVSILGKETEDEVVNN